MTDKPQITLDTLVEEIVQDHPKAVGWLVHRGVVCMACSEPAWGTIGDLMKRKNIKDPEKLIEELNEYLATIQNQFNTS